MPEQRWIYALTTPTPAPPGHRWLMRQGAACLDEVPAQVAALPSGVHVLLGGDTPRPGLPGRFTSFAPVTALADWPAVLTLDLLTAPHTVERDRLLLSTRGAWAVDPQGRPAELGHARLPGGARALVVSYAGLTLAVLERLELPLWRVTIGEALVFVIPPDAFAESREVVPSAELPARVEPDWEAWAEVSPRRVPRDEEPAPPPAAAPPAAAPAAPPRPAKVTPPQPPPPLGLFDWRPPES